MARASLESRKGKEYGDPLQCDRQLRSGMDYALARGGDSLGKGKVEALGCLGNSRQWVVDDTYLRWCVGNVL